MVIVMPYFYIRYGFFIFIFFSHSSEILMEAQNLEINKNVAQNPHSTSQKDSTKKQARSVYTISATKKVTISKPPTDFKQPNRPEGNNIRQFKKNMMLHQFYVHTVTVELQTII